MVIHTKERFQIIVAALNQQFDGFMVFQLAGSLADKPASYHDADIIVHPRILFDMDAFSKGCKLAGMEIVEVDKTSATPFPGRPEGQDRIKLKFGSGEVIDLFFPKGSLDRKSHK
ncbi:MAG TPA: hypothetical protein VK699_16895 [Terriglobales bacterium]|nr:hypothetical protein [Terriglobales bacterium]